MINEMQWRSISEQTFMIHPYPDYTRIQIRGTYMNPMNYDLDNSKRVYCSKR